MITMEDALKGYERGFYIEDKALFPTDYSVIRKLHRAEVWTYHFFVTYLWTLAATLALVVLTWIGFCHGRTAQCDRPTEHHRSALMHGLDGGEDESLPYDSQEVHDGQLP